jgi:hypothetical protein
MVLVLPPGFRVKTVPEPIEGTTPFGRYGIRVEVTPAKVVVKTVLSIERTSIARSDYAAWRAFCEAVDRAFLQRLVIGATK